MFLALGCYLLGGAMLLLPKRLELMAHYAGMALATAGSAGVTVATLQYFLTAARPTLLSVSWGGYTLSGDLWSMPFLLLTGLAGTIISLYGIDYAKGYLGKRIRQLTGLWNFFLLSMMLVLLAADAFTFMVAWELMALFSFLLVNHESDKKETVSAAYQYMVMTHLGTAAILVCFYILGSSAGGFSFAAMAQSQLTGTLRHIAFATAFLGFALKAGLMPLHIWLPNAHPAAPSHVSAIMSGVMLKIALYGFGRVALQFIGVSDCFYYGAIVMVAGLLSAFLGVLYATMETDIKRILAYSSVENMGIIFAAFGCGMVMMNLNFGYWALVAFVAAVVHAFSHSFMKALLFMSAGAVMHATGSKNLEKMGGLAKKMPYTAFFTLIGSMSLSALPFTSGLVGEWLTLQSFITLAGQVETPSLRILTIFAFIMLGLTGATALGCFVRLYGVAFLGQPRSSIVAKAHEMPFFMLLGMGLEAALVVLFGLLPGPLVTLAEFSFTGGQSILHLGGLYGLTFGGSGSMSVYSPLLIFIFVLAACGVMLLLLGGSLKRSDVTWNCGTEPTSRQQYSATGFSKPLRRAFDTILSPKRERVYLRKEHSYFGRKLQYKLEIPDLFTDKLYKPMQHLMVTLSSMVRQLQAGSVRLYIGYTMAAMLLVLIWGVW